MERFTLGGRVWVGREGGGVAPKSWITPVPELCSLTMTPNLEPNSKLTQVYKPLVEVPGVPHLAVHGVTPEIATVLPMAT